MKFCFEKPERYRSLAHTGGRIILKWILENMVEAPVDWIHLTHNRVQQCVPVNIERTFLFGTLTCIYNIINCNKTMNGVWKVMSPCLYL
jgi:hypothetical protein